MSAFQAERRGFESHRPLVIPHIPFDLKIASMTNLMTDYTNDEGNVILQCATDAAIGAGDVIEKFLGSLASSDISQKSSWKDLVTVADKKSEAHIIEKIKECFPEHLIICEESFPDEAQNKKIIQEGQSEYAWIIDPLDGTVNFSHSFPFFCVSIGILKNKKRKFAVVWDPIKKELFTAVKNKGAYLNGVPIRVSETELLKNSLVSTGMSWMRSHDLKTSIPKVIELNSLCHGIRRNGSTALDLCYVASGRLDCFFDAGQKSWDLAAGSLIIEEAGGKISNPSNLNSQSKQDSQDDEFDIFSGAILAGNRSIHDEISLKFFS